MSLARKAAVGALWQVGGSIGARIIGVVGTLVLTRFLAPDVLGEVGAAAILVLTANLFTNAALGQYIVAKPDLAKRDVFQATFMSIGTALIGAAVILPLAVPLGPLFNAEGLEAFVPGLVLAMVVERVAEMPERILTRDLRFNVIATGTALGELTYTGVTIGLAIAGYGGFAVVWGNIAQWTLRLVIFTGAVKPDEWLSVSRPDWKRIRDMYRFGVPIALANFSDHLAVKFDNLLVSSLFGKAAMGLYNLAYNLAEIPSMHVGEAMADVLMPSFAKMDKDHRKVALVRSIGLMSLVIFPMAVGLGAVSDTLVATLFNDEWQGLAPLLMILCILSIAHPLPNAVIVYLKASDRNMPVWGLQVIYLVSALTLVAGLGQFSMEAAAYGAGLAAVIRMVVSGALVVRQDTISPLALFKCTMPPLIACAAMAAAVFGIRELLGWSPGVLLLIVEITLGAIVYTIAGILLMPSVSRDFIGLFMKAVGRD